MRARYIHARARVYELWHLGLNLVNFRILPLKIISVSCLDRSGGDCMARSLTALYCSSRARARWRCMKLVGSGLIRLEMVQRPIKLWIYV